MSLRNALLALLTVEPMTGYDLAKRFESSVGHVWYAPDSQIYPELRKMEQAGLVTGVEVPWGTRGTKREYHVTDAGVAAFREWMNTPLDYARVRDPSHLKAAYLEWASPDAAREIFAAHIAHHENELRMFEEEIAEIDAVTDPMLAARLEKTPEADRHRVTAFKRFAYEGLVARAEQEIEWAKRGRRLIDELGADAGPGPADAPRE